MKQQSDILPVEHTGSGEPRGGTTVLQRMPWQSLGRWWIVGLAFLVVGTAVLYAFKELLHMPLMAATLVSAEVTLLIRFLINDRWVFGNRSPTGKRLWQFHMASAGGFVIWWVVANTLPRFGLHYLIASAAGSACSVFFSMLTNFVWIWRRRASPQAREAGSVE